jgi:hypothetical protein
MNLSQLKSTLNKLETIRFELPDGSLVPAHFHVTEIGQVNKHYIDCGGTLRKEEKISFQLFTAEDYDHRLSVQRFTKIINLAENALQLNDAEIEVEFQSETIGKYDLGFNGQHFQLLSKKTTCLAEDACGIPQQKTKISMASLGTTTNEQANCKPGSGCC